MTESAERVLVDWLREGPERGPEHGLERALAATRRERQRPGWMFLGTWVPARVTTRVGYVPRAAYLFLITALLIVAIAAAAQLIASRRVPPPFGPAGNGSMIFSVEGEIWVTDADGENAREVRHGLEESYSPAFSLDGTRLAFFAQPSRLVSASLYVASADGTDPVKLSGDVFFSVDHDAVISWSPDGSRVAFSSSDRRLFVAATDASGVAPISDFDADRREPAWSPDGKWLAYRLSGTPDGLEHLAVIRPDGTGERTLLDASRHSSRLSFVGPAWSPDSSRLAYYRAESADLVVGTVDLEGHEVVLSEAGEEASLPAWSPDGSRIAYLKGSVSGRGGAVVVDVTTHARVTIPPGPADCGTIVWAPDGKALLGIDGECTGAFRIPLDAPESATRIPVPAGAFSGSNWQRVAP